MKVETLQIPNSYSKPKNSTAEEEEDNFPELLSGIMNVDKEITDDKAVEVEADYMELTNPFFLMLNITVTEDKIVDMNLLADNPVEIRSNEVLPMLNLVDTNMINTENPNPVDINTSNFDFGTILGLEEVVAVEDKVVKAEVVDDINLDIFPNNRLKVHDINSNANNKMISVEEDIISVNEVKAPPPEKLLQEEELIVLKAKVEEKVGLKDKDTIGIDRLINRNLETSPKPITNNSIIQPPKVISNENLQNINNSIIQLMETTTDGSTSTMKVQLYPEELGAINITLKMEDGKLIAKILVDDDYVKQLFTGEIEKLSNSLKGQNVSMEKIFVELNSSTNSDSSHNEGRFEKQKPEFNFARKSLEQIIKEEAKAELGVLSILA